MLTIDLDLELEASLAAVAKQKHCTQNELIKKLLSHYLTDYQSNNNHFSTLVDRIKPVKAAYSAEEMGQMLREGKEQFLIAAHAHHVQ
ncbi:MAG: hypothetical protein PHU06_07590 [Gallionella sp.]|nr:hypothetical protein [Gallionella sp.]MDD4959013.1 hypothetical protein [Gallionella sp.]